MNKFDEIEQRLDELLDSPEFDETSRKFFGDLVEDDGGKEARQDFENDVFFFVRQNGNDS